MSSPYENLLYSLSLLFYSLHYFILWTLVICIGISYCTIRFYRHKHFGLVWWLTKCYPCSRCSAAYLCMCMCLMSEWKEERERFMKGFSCSQLLEFLFMQLSNPPWILGMSAVVDSRPDDRLSPRPFQFQPVLPSMISWMKHVLAETTSILTSITIS